MAKLQKYNLQDFNDIIFNGFDYELPKSIIEIINKLSCEVGSPSYIKTPIFKKKDANTIFNLKKKINKGPHEIEEDWTSIRTFQTTKIEQKIGIDIQIDLIRCYLNKMTDKNYIEMNTKIKEVLDKLVEDEVDENDMMRVGKNIFEIASNNRFYSKLYADLYTELMLKYDVMKILFDNSLNSYLEMFNNIEYIDASENYDKFCKINKINENRKALSMFFINLMLNSILSKEVISNLIVCLLKQVSILINQENKKNEVDELTENIAILFKKEYIDNLELKQIDDMTIVEFIEKIAHSKSKSYLSLSNKSIFKFMDMVDM
jgi:hypothetical protein